MDTTNTSLPKDTSYWARKVKEILLNKLVCGICLNFDEEMSNVNIYFHIFINQRAYSCTLLNIVSVVFKNTNLANTEICSNCTNSLLRSFIFIENAKQTLKTLDYHLNKLLRNTLNPINNSVISLEDFECSENESNDDVYETNIDDYDSTDALESENTSSKCLTCSENLTDVELDSHQCNFSCNDCEKIPCIHYKYLTSYREQIVNRINEAKCLDCEYVYKSKDDLIIHVNMQHLNNDSNTCNKCGQSIYSKPEQDTHICSVDGTKDNYNKKRKKDINSVNCKQKNKTNDCLDCVVCQAKFFTKYAFLLHMKKHGPGTKYPCRICNTQYDTLTQYKIHNRQHSNPFAVCKVCGKKVRQYFLNKHMKTHKDLALVCETCGKAFQKSRSLYDHLRTHGERIPCTKCNELISPIRFSKHLRWHDIQDDPVLKAAAKKPQTLKCDFCDYKTTYTHTLEPHVNRYHLKIKPYKCHVCKKAFMGKDLLRKHVETHSIEKSVRCYECGKTLANTKCLKIHMMRHTNEKPYTCEVCGERFRTSSMMNVHKIKKHSDKNCACPLCAKKFYTLKELRSHVKKVHWKNKGKKFDPRQLKGLSEEHYHLFHDRRRVKLSDGDLELNT